MAVSDNDTGDNDTSNSGRDNNSTPKQNPVRLTIGNYICRIAGRAASRGMTASAHAARMTYYGLRSRFNNAPD